MLIFTAESPSIAAADDGRYIFATLVLIGGQKDIRRDQQRCTRLPRSAACGHRRRQLWRANLKAFLRIERRRGGETAQ